MSAPFRDLVYTALEQHADGSLASCKMRFSGSESEGFEVLRNDSPWLRVGPGHRVLRVRSCGVCSTDLARRFLPFRLPQITGHEVLAEDERGRRLVVEINDSHAARGERHDCAFCSSGLHTHCPERLVLGIDELPGGFGPYVLAPRRAILEVPRALPDAAALLVEPFAAAWNAVDSIAPRERETVAVLGPRKLGMLVIAALRHWRDLHDVENRIAAITRRPALAELARALGADVTWPAEPPPPPRSVDVVVDTTGDPRALALALTIARREVHVKSTHGRTSCGLAHLTELVVDEVSVRSWSATSREDLEGRRVAWISSRRPPAWLADRTRAVVAPTAAAALDEIERAVAPGEIPRADYVVVDGAGQVDQALRPRPGRQDALVRPRGAVLLAGAGSGPLAEAVVERGVTVSSSRCGAFAPALQRLTADPELQRLGERLITHEFPASELERALALAASPTCLKAVVLQ